MAPVSAPKATPGGYVLLTGKLPTSATAPQLETVRRAIDKHRTNARLDFASMAAIRRRWRETAGRSARACAQEQRCALTLQRTEKMRAALDILLRRGREAGEGPWLLALELLQFDQKQEAVRRARDRVCDRVRAVAAVVGAAARARRRRPARRSDGEPCRRGARAESRTRRLERRADRLWRRSTSRGSPSMRSHHAVVPIDMTDVERIDFVCAGSLLNAITRVEAQRKAVQIVGASPIIRALLLLIGISPRHFLKKPQ